MIFEKDKILISAFEVQTTHVRVLQGLVFAIHLFIIGYQMVMIWYPKPE